MSYHFRLSNDEFEKYLQDYFNCEYSKKEDGFYEEHWSLYLKGARYCQADSFFITVNDENTEFEIKVEPYGQIFIYKPNKALCMQFTTLPEYIINKEKERMNKVIKVDLGHVDAADLAYDAFSDALSSSWTSDYTNNTSSINVSKLAETAHSKWCYDPSVMSTDTICIGTAGTIGDSISTKADIAYVNSKIEALEADINEIKVNGDPLGETIKFKNNEYIKVVRKEENNMFNFDFGPCKDSNIKMSTYGLAVKDAAGKWVSYDKVNDSIVDVSPLTFGDGKYFYKMPVAIKDIKEGDVIIHEKRPMFVGKVLKDGDLSVVDIMSAERKVIMPVKNMFGFNFYTKVVSLMDMAGATAQPSEDNPFGNPMMFLLMDDNKDIDPMMMALFMGGGQINQQMLMYMALAKK